MTKKEMITKGLTIKHSGKMEGMVSFSTNTANNPFCNKMRSIEGCICSKCYAYKMTRRFSKRFSDKLDANEWIKTEVLEKKDVPFINAAYFRFEAFGELETFTQLLNYLTIAKYNPHCNFALWTKRVDFIYCLDLDHKPKNVNIIVSSPTMNKQLQLTDKIKSKVDGVFTVYDKSTVDSEGVPINCGSRKCVECLACYKKSKTFKVINELVK